ncbi:hypothetical protein B0H16DRAFT_203281 [Mycena metata]|uniref:DUF7779 domain-containing protein n=1 Tax=Mycena metata TaxID=1033252 RepID=A0AAD7MSZ7_9AGAR|nr:hypothetical protein B0H16DRAFT_203281 [Mycena metata]
MDKYFGQDLDKQCIYVLHGLGGAGKTQIALKFIQQSSSFTSTFFVDASTTKTIETGFKNIAKLRNAGDSSADAVKWLVAKPHNWLVFFDNADNPKLNLNKFLPQCNHGNIIITSRNPELRIYGGSAQVSDMEEEDAVTLLLKSAAQEPLPTNQESAVQIVRALWYLPLAIVQAGAFIARTRALDHYLALYSRNCDKLMRERPAQSHSNYAWTVYTTWQMSFDQLSASAAMFLQLCSFLHRDGISEDIFSRAADYDFPSIGPSKVELQQPLEFLSQFQGPSGEWDTLAFLEVINEITSYSLATFAPEKRTFSIHPLVHRWSRDTLADPELKYDIIHSIVGMSIWEIPQIDSQLASLKLLPHVDAIMQFQSYGARDFKPSYGRLYSWANRHHEAKAFKVSALERQRAFKSDDDLDILYLVNSLAITYEKLGQLKDAEELEVVVVEKRREILGDDHPETLRTMHRLAVVYRRLGQFRKAEELGAMVVEKQRTILGEGHPQTLDAMHNLAITYKDLGQPQRAEELEVVVVEKRRAILGEDHPATLDAMYNLAITYKNLGQPQKAEGLQAVVLEKRRVILGQDHPETLNAMGNLAVTYKHLGHPQKAEELELVVVKKRRAILGEYHPETLNAMYNLAITYRDLGQPQKAEELEVVMVEKRRAILGADHPETLSAMAVIYASLSHFEEAERLQLEVMKKHTVLGDSHPHTILSINNLPLTYRALEKGAEAPELEVPLPDDEEGTSASNAVE